MQFMMLEEEEEDEEEGFSLSAGSSFMYTDMLEANTTKVAM